MRIFPCIVLLCAFWPGTAASESAKKPTACLDAAAKAEARHGIPRKLLQAITLVETGRSEGDEFVAWPWTTNIDATGRYFQSKNDVARFVRSRLHAGETSIDIGCFQINTKWHGDNFASIDDMLDPTEAAEYAAKFLVDLKNEFGDWETAATKYHSRTPVHARRYGQKLAAIQDSLLKAPRKPESVSITLAPPTRFAVNETNTGGVALSIFADAAPLFEQGSRPSIIRGGPTP